MSRQGDCSSLFGGPIKATIAILALLLFLTACYRLPKKEEAHLPSTVNASEYQPLWTAINTRTIQSVLNDQLEIRGGVPEEDEILNTFNENQKVLGKGDYAKSIVESYAPEPAKFKVYSDLFFNACYVGTKKSSVAQKVFPGIASQSAWDRESFKTLYLTFLGRDPLKEEVDTLLGLVNHSSLNTLEKDMAAACTAVLCSVEFTNSR